MAYDKRTKDIVEYAGRRPGVVTGAVSLRPAKSSIEQLVLAVITGLDTHASCRILCSYPRRHTLGSRYQRASDIPAVRKSALYRTSQGIHLGLISLVTSDLAMKNIQNPWIPPRCDPKARRLISSQLIGESLLISSGTYFVIGSSRLRPVFSRRRSVKTLEIDPIRY
jgi:hypothetical protein